MDDSKPLNKPTSMSLSIAPATIGRFTPAWLIPWIMRFGGYLQDIGRESYYACQGERRQAIYPKLSKVLDGDRD